MITNQKKFVHILISHKNWLFPWLAGLLLILASCVSPGTSSMSTPSVSTTIPVLSETRLPTINPVATSTPTVAFTDPRKKLSSGLYIAYWSENTWWLRGVNGTSSLQLIPGKESELYTDIQISSNSNRVVFSNTPGKVSIYDQNTGELSTYLNSKVRYAYQFQWLLDGNTLLYLGTPEQYWIPDAQVGIYSISTLTGETNAIVSWGDQRFPFGLANLSLSPDGHWLAFDAPLNSEVAAPDPGYQVYLMDTSCLSKPESCIEAIYLVSSGSKPGWSSNGRLWWVCSQGDSSALCFKEPKSQASSKIFITASELTNSDDAILNYFSWSPDSKYVAINVQIYQSDQSDETRDEIYLLPADGYNPVKVTAVTDENEYLEAWSHDSRYLVYSLILGYTEPKGDLGIRFAQTGLYLYDIQNHTKFDFITTPGNRAVFGFFMNVK